MGEQDKRETTLTIGSLFSGIGGIEYGLEQSGNFRTIWHSELDSYASAILAKRWPDCPNLGDITQINWDNVQSPDVLCGGFPCQDISNAGKREGITGARSSLWKEMHKAIRILRPKVVLIENVSALLSRGLDVVLADLAQIGYNAEWDCLGACTVGAPHHRHRIFILAYPCGRGEYGKQCEKGFCEKRRFNDVADSDQEGLQRSKTTKNIIESWKNTQQLPTRQSNVENTLSNRDDQRNRNKNHRRKESTEYSNHSELTGWWTTEPDVGRVAHGVPFRVDRIKCLGNAVVPQVATFFSEKIKELALRR